MQEVVLGYTCILAVLLNIYMYILYSALVWGSSVKHNPQKVGKEHVLNDEDVVQIAKKLVNILH